ncbi:MAG: hypothetical protein IJV97_02925 [Alphaproteobacteria bacterium]|nr:hypothetical protein [Alphaproteobacteria bacterium]
MNKWYLLIVLFLSACVKAGDFNILSQRNDIFYALNGYKITPYEEEELKLVKVEKIIENNFKVNQAQTVDKGQSVLTNKIFVKEYFAKEFLKANKNGVMNSSSLPVMIKSDKQYKITGSVVIDGKTFYLIPSELEDYRILMNEDGTLYDKIGQVKGDYLILLDIEFFPYPADLKMQTLTASFSKQSESVTGYDVRFDGVRLDRIWFTYMDYSQPEGGEFKNLSFPNKPGLITINGIGFRVLKVDDKKITYMVLAN